MGMEQRVDISDSLGRTRLFPALLVMARDTGVVVGTSFDSSVIKNNSEHCKYSTRNVNLYMINDRIGYTHDRIG